MNSHRFSNSVDNFALTQKLKTSSKKRENNHSASRGGIPFEERKPSKVNRIKDHCHDCTKCGKPKVTKQKKKIKPIVLKKQNEKNEYITHRNARTNLTYLVNVVKNPTNNQIRIFKNHAPNQEDESDEDLNSIF